MRTRMTFRQLCTAATLGMAAQVWAQADVLNHNGGTNFYLGWGTGALQPLDIKHEGDYPIDFFTTDTKRMRLQEDATYTIGYFASQVKDGSLLLCPKVDGFYANGAPGPYSLLHQAAADDNAQVLSYREWMNTGITFTGNKDHDYIGQKARMDHGEPMVDYTDMVAHWSDNPGESLKDRFRFLFTSGYDQNATSGARSVEGLEFLRMWPARYEDPRIGIGDFYAANLADPVHVTEPTERLDMVNGRARLRQLPNDPVASDGY